MCKISPRVYKKYSLDTVMVLKFHCSYFVYIFIYLVLYISFSTIFVCRIILYFTATMAEANGICKLAKEGIQSILEGYSVNDSDRSLPQVPNKTLGLSSVRQNLSSSFNRLRRGITNRIGKNTSQPQNQTPMEVDAEQLSPTSLHTQLKAYQSTVRTLHEQNDRNTELLRHLEAAVTEKDAEISCLQNEEMEKISGFRHSITTSKHNYLQNN